ncbi:MAG: pentapeptide repeat-containing protein [Pseudomonadota bacterium]
MLDSSDFRKFDNQQIIDSLGGTEASILKTVFSLTILTIVSLLSITLPDVYLINPNLSLGVPSIGAVASNRFLFIGPTLLLVLHLYLHLHFRRWQLLVEVSTSRNIRRPPLIYPLQNHVLAPIVKLLIHLLVPICLVGFAWKAMAVPSFLSHALLFMALFTAMFHPMQVLPTSSKARLIGAGLMAAAFTILAVFEFPDFARRPLNLRYADLHRIDLRHIDFRNADLRQADLRETDLRQAALLGANLERANLAGANMEKALLVGANIGWVNFDGADLEAADIRLAFAKGAQFLNTDLKFADLEDACLARVRFSGSSLRGAVLRKTLIVEADMSNTNLRDTKFDEAILLRTNLQNTNIEESQLATACGDNDTMLPNRINLQQCNLEQAENICFDYP